MRGGRWAALLLLGGMAPAWSPPAWSQSGQPGSTQTPAGADLSGTWKLDEGASEPMDEILKARGVNWVERQMMELLPMTWVIEQTPTAVIVAVEATGYSRRDEYPADGQARTLEEGREGPMVQRCWWEGGAFVVETRLALPDDTPATWRVTRSLGPGGDILFYDALLKADDGRTWTARRVLWRVPGT